MGRLNIDKKGLKKFGITMGMSLLVISAVLFARHKQAAPALSVSIIFVITAFIAPVFLKPIYAFWMGLAFVLGWINTRLILLIVFYLILTPMGLIARLLGKDPLDRKADRAVGSYWKKKEIKGFNLSEYERQF